MAPHVEVVMSTRCSIHKYILGGWLQGVEIRKVVLLEGWMVEG